MAGPAKTAPGGRNKMPVNSNRYLIVAGGTGKGLLGKRAALNFLYEWQIDVQSERAFPDSAGFKFIPLDTFVGTVANLASHYQEHAAAPPGMAQHTSPYLTTRAASQAVKNHAAVYWDNVPNAMLMFGLAQEPAIGAACARYPDNEINLRAQLGRITQGVGLANSVEVWIVSSTAGGTGQGIHRYIAALVADMLKNNTDTSVHIHFVQIGQATYGTAGNKCKLNTFMGVAADAAFSHLLTGINVRAVPAWYYLDLRDVGVGLDAKRLRAELVEMSVKTIMNQKLKDDLNQLVINNGGLPFVLARTGFWGKDFDETSKYKQTLSTTAAKLKLLLMPKEDMPDRARQLLANAAESDKPHFNETPTYSDAINKSQNSTVIEAWLRDGAKVPPYSVPGASALRPDADSWQPTLRTAANNLVSSWKIAFGTMGVSVDELGGSFSFRHNIDGQTTQHDLACRRNPFTGRLNKEWEDAVGVASITKLWGHYLLEGFSSADANPSLLAQFMELTREADKVGKNWLHSSQKKSRLLAPLLGKLLAALVKISVLEKSLKQTQTHLDEALRSAKLTAEYTAAILDTLAADPSMQPTILAANLSDVLNEATGETWLNTMHSRAELNDPNAFRGAVLAGATGLTQNGLREVLDLPSTAGAKEMAEELVNEPVEVTVGGGRAGAQQVAPIHWQNSLPSGITKEYFYRLLPQISENLKTELLRVPSPNPASNKNTTLFTEHTITCAFEEMGRTGLYVMAFHGISLSQKNQDYFSAAKYMLRPMVQYVRNELNHWTTDPATIGAAPTGNYNVAAACAIGEPLDLGALIAAGLTEEEILKIATYCRIYSDKVRNGPNILDGVEAVTNGYRFLHTQLSPFLQ